MRRLSDEIRGVMRLRSRHRRVDRMSRVLGAKSLAHVTGKGSTDDHESESKRQKASSHLNPSIPDRIANGDVVPAQTWYLKR
jgi:hypothetical protein